MRGIGRFQYLTIVAHDGVSYTVAPTDCTHGSQCAIIADLIRRWRTAPDGKVAFLGRASNEPHRPLGSRYDLVMV